MSRRDQRGAPATVACYFVVKCTVKPGQSENARFPTDTDLVAGSGITFQDRGEHKLKGVPDPWRLFAVDA